MTIQTFLNIARISIYLIENTITLHLIALWYGIQTANDISMYILQKTNLASKKRQNIRLKKVTSQLICVRFHWSNCDWLNAT